MVRRRRLRGSEGVGLLLAIEPIADLGRTAFNVPGQALVPAIGVKRHGILDEARYDSVRIDGYVPVIEEVEESDFEGVAT